MEDIPNENESSKYLDDYFNDELDNNLSDNDYSNDDYSNEHEDFKDDFGNELYDDYTNFKNSIIYFDEPLRYIINNIEINVIYKDIKVNLLDYLPLFKKGYTTNENLINIFDMYEYLYDIDPFTNSLYLKAFVGEVPDKYFLLHQKSDNAGNIAEVLLEKDLIDKLNQHYEDYETDIDGNIKLESFIFNMKGTETYDWVHMLLDSELKLYVAIILDYDFLVEQILNETDPRDNDNESYHLAVKVNNEKNNDINGKEVINLIKNRIIELNWLDKQVVIKEFGKHDLLIDDIIKYYQSRKY